LEHLFAGIPFASRTHQIDLAVLGACQQSKTVGNRHYELSFETKFDGYDDGFGHGPGAEITIKTLSQAYVNGSPILSVQFREDPILGGTSSQKK
jgi:hypothetical protein